MDRWDEVHIYMYASIRRWPLEICLFLRCAFISTLAFSDFISIIYREVTTAYIEEMNIFYRGNLPMHGGRFIIDQ